MPVFSLFSQNHRDNRRKQAGHPDLYGEPDWSKLKHLPKKHIKGRLSLTMMGGCPAMFNNIHTDPASYSEGLL
jgi:hypothetical protein